MCLPKEFLSTPTAEVDLGAALRRVLIAVKVFWLFTSFNQANLVSCVEIRFSLDEDLLWRGNNIATKCCPDCGEEIIDVTAVSHRHNNCMLVASKSSDSVETGLESAPKQEGNGRTDVQKWRRRWDMSNTERGKSNFERLQWRLPMAVMWTSSPP